MSYDSDPPRMSDGASGTSPELQGLFQNAQRDVPNDAQLERLLTRLGPVVGAGAALAGDAVRAGAQHAAAQASTTSVATLTKVVTAIAGAGIIASGIAFFSTGDGEEERTQSRSSATARSAAVAAPPAPPAEPPAPVVTTPEPSAAPELTSPARGPRAEQPTDNVKAEAALLERARTIAAGDPKRALALTKEHARRFPRGVLAQEREVIAIEALRQLGLREEADGRATRFRETYPGSAHQRTVGSSSSEK